MELFGLDISRKSSKTEKSFVPPHDDGSLESIKAGGYYGTYFDIEGTANNETQLIKRYRDISMMGDVDAAIEDVVNDAIANLDDEKPVKLNLDKVNQGAAVKKAIFTEFDSVLRMLDFNTRAQDYFRRWYIDGRIFFHKVVDTDKPKEGIKDVRYVDPRKIRKVREITKGKDSKTEVTLVKNVDEYFVFDEKGIAANSGMSYRSDTANDKAIKVNKDAVTYCTSGLVDQDKNIPLSYLHKAIRPANQLRMMENAVVIYRITRAPERRIFYIDVGNLPTGKAEQYLKDVMSRYRNKLVYDSDTGEIRDDKKMMSMLEDFWLPRKEGGRGTEIQTLPGGANLGEIEDVVYFQKKLYQSLNVPVSRLEQQAGLNFGRSAEITRDELKFTKFVSKLRTRFSGIFDDILKTQLILKGIITEDEWPDIKHDIQYMFAQDAYYTESKEQEILRSRLEILNNVAPFVGQLFSKDYVQRNILKFSDEEINIIDKQIASSATENEITNGESDE
jgi:hypothetical protein|tara:strand:+ start:1891 stop:3399 length:1509 start_codon:yes stop_codon:yes gene_type:complete